MKGLRKIAVFTMVVSSIMAVSVTSAFAHCGGGRGGRGNGYRYYSQSSYSCPYGNSACNQQGYCIDHNAQYYANPNVYTAPTANQQVIVQQESVDTQQVQAATLDAAINTEQINNGDVAIENRASVEAELKKILEANKAIEAAKAATVNQAATTVPQSTTIPQSTYVCPNGNAICNQYGYCINNGNCYNNGYCGGYGCGHNYGGYLY